MTPFWEPEGRSDVKSAQILVLYDYYISPRERKIAIDRFVLTASTDLSLVVWSACVHTVIGCVFQRNGIYQSSSAGTFRLSLEAKSNADYRPSLTLAPLPPFPATACSCGGRRPDGGWERPRPRLLQGATGGDWACREARGLRSLWEQLHARRRPRERNTQVSTRPFHITAQRHTNGDFPRRAGARRRLRVYPSRAWYLPFVLSKKIATTIPLRCLI